MDTQQATAATPASSGRVILTVKQFAQRHPAFSEGSLRHMIFMSKDRKSSRGKVRGNGLEKAIKRLGAKVTIDEAKFFEWYDAHDAKK